ncbi:MAG: pyridoxamine 5'-phosphate oxidase [Planctomycetota bacterium]|nr:pyridoxamine 5'-phosphate oxidase [Planctomycetota bacterium]MDA1113175.1 pyridoxamine 5'-phosphate oxidase [Planctomycetota bacterium]
MDLGDLRREYSRIGLKREELHANPMHQFGVWFEQACNSGLGDPSAFSLATASADGAPSIRTVLLKLFDEEGFVFFTNYASKKARQIEENPQVAMLCHWLPLERQIKITGRAEKISKMESMKYFATRPRGSQLGAWISPQSSVITSRRMLEGKLREAIDKLAGGEIPMPEKWGGYRIFPETIEFWQGRENRLHDRFRYRKQEPGPDWIVERLAP